MGSKEVHEIIKNMGTELNSYKVRKIFTPKEIQDIIINRKKYELKLQRTKKNLSDCVNYIKHEKKILKKRNKAMEKKCISVEKSDEELLRNIVRIYNRAFNTFEAKELIKEYADFCIKIGFIEEMKDMLTKQLLKNAKDEDLWIFSSRKFWEVEDIESARNMLMKGMSVVENKKVMYVEFFKLEVMYADKSARFNREMGVDKKDYGEIENGEIAVEMFKEVVQKCTELEVQQCLRLSKLLPGLRERLKELLIE